MIHSDRWDDEYFELWAASARVTAPREVTLTLTGRASPNHDGSQPDAEDVAEWAEEGAECDGHPVGDIMAAARDLSLESRVSVRWQGDAYTLTVAYTVTDDPAAPPHYGADNWNPWRWTPEVVERAHRVWLWLDRAGPVGSELELKL